MDATYTIIGADGQQYGPITLEQIKLWAGEHRLTPETRVLRSDTKSWLPAAQYPELGVIPPAQTAPSPPPMPARPSADAPLTAALARRTQSGARWFYWIAGLSLVNTFMTFSKQGYSFFAGLGVTQLIDAFAAHAGAAAIGLILDAVVAGLFVLCGLFASKGQTWGFIVGAVLYLLDALLILGLAVGFQAEIPFLELAFHGFVLFCLFNGFRACRQWQALARDPGSAS